MQLLKLRLLLSKDVANNYLVSDCPFTEQLCHFHPSITGCQLLPSTLSSRSRCGRVTVSAMVEDDELF